MQTLISRNLRKRAECWRRPEPPPELQALLAIGAILAGGSGAATLHHLGMVTDGTAGRSAEDGVMSSQMAGDTTHSGA